MTTVDEPKTQAEPTTETSSGTQVVARQSAPASKKRKTAKKSVGQKTGDLNPFDVRVDDAGTVMPSFWRFGG